MGLCVLWNAIHLDGETLMMTLDLVLLVLALVCFLAAAANVSSPRVNLTAAGLAFWMASVLL